MPELPEVETIKRGLAKFIMKKRLKGVKILCEKSFIGEAGLVTSGEVIGMRRFGKALVIDFDNGYSLMIHLRMTGQLIFDPEEDFEGWDAKSDLGAKEGAYESSGTSVNFDERLEKKRFAAGHPSDNFTDKLPNKQTRVVLEFENGTLYFNDQRKFGFIKVLEMDEVLNDSFIKKLAPEPWVIDVREFYEKLQRHKLAPIKAVILDQSVISGLGNIYADEALYASRIHPETPAGNLSLKQAEEVVEAAKMVMEKSINSGGSTMKTYVKADGTKGDYLEKFAQVFRREGQKCLRCGAIIIKTKVAGRGTHLCPECQKSPLLSGKRGAYDSSGENRELRETEGE